MNSIALEDHEGPRSPFPVIDITPFARRAHIPYATSVSVGISELYGLAAPPSLGERPDLDDLVWQISRRFKDLLLNPTPPEKTARTVLVEFASFLAGQRDAKDIRAAVTLFHAPHNRQRLQISLPDECAPGLLPLILVAEDDCDIGRCLCRFLAKHGFHPIWLRTAMDTMEYAAQYLPDAVLVDVDLPDLHGFNVCSKLRADASTRNIPLVISSAWHGAEATAISVGAAAYIEKPNFSGLLPNLQRILTDSGTSVSEH